MFVDRVLESAAGGTFAARRGLSEQPQDERSDRDDPNDAEGNQGAKAKATRPAAQSRSTTHPMRDAPPVTIVGHDVGISGGMERQLAELVVGLLGREYRVTVVARRCEVAPHPHLRWIRVPGPSRPFSVAYPWFFLIGSLLVWHLREGLLHTTGAVVLNNADVSTVHFCHRAVRQRTTLLRASRQGMLYRLNAWMASRMSLLAERFCYRPRRTRHLVAVSNGVAQEIVSLFPAIAGKSETISDRKSTRLNSSH